MPHIQGFLSIPLFKNFLDNKILGYFSTITLLASCDANAMIWHFRFKIEKKSLDEARAQRLELISMANKNKQRNRLMGFLCDPGMFEKSPDCLVFWYDL
jgi:hypothetical protein